jgi:hypothetical protein
MLLIVFLLAPSSSAADLILGPDRCVSMSDVRMVTGRRALGGLTGMRVMVSDRFSWGQNAPLADSLRADIERVLTQGGIRMFSEEECSKAPGHPTLEFRTFGRHVSLDLRETACFTRLPDACTPTLNFGMETSYSVQEARMAADSVRVTLEEQRQKCADQEIQMLHFLAADLTQTLVRNLQYANRREAKK